MPQALTIDDINNVPQLCLEGLHVLEAGWSIKEEILNRNLSADRGTDRLLGEDFSAFSDQQGPVVCTLDRCLNRQIAN